MAKKKLLIDKEAYTGFLRMLNSSSEADINLALDAIAARDFTKSPVYTLMLIKNHKGKEKVPTKITKWMRLSGIDTEVFPTYTDIYRKAVESKELELFEEFFSEHVRKTLVDMGYLFVKNINIELNHDDISGLTS